MSVCEIETEKDRKRKSEMDMETGAKTEMEEKQETKSENSAESGQRYCTWDTLFTSSAGTSGDACVQGGPLIPVQPGFIGWLHTRFHKLLNALCNLITAWSPKGKYITLSLPATS